MVQNSSVRSHSNQMVEGSSTSDADCGCTWNGYTLCTRLQSLAKPQFFLITLILAGIVQGISETYYGETILSSKFGIPFTTTRWLILGGEIAVVILAIPIIFWGSTRRRPGWLAGSVVFFSVCSINLAINLLMERKNLPANYNSITDLTICRPWNQYVWYDKLKWNWIIIFVIPVLQFAASFSRIAYWAFGITYIDDNSATTISPLLIGVALAMKQYGPFIGLFMSSISVTTALMGINWLICGVALLIAAILIGIFPRRLSGSTFNQAGDSGLISALRRILSNKIIIFSGLTAIFLQTFIFNATTIEEKYIQSAFYISRSSLYGTIFSLQYLFGISKPTVAAISILISGIVIYLVKPRPLYLCIWSIISICIACGALFAIIFLKCSATPIHRESYGNNLVEYCNKDCGCSEDLPFMPSCTPFYPFVYYSPCHAGCTAYYERGGSKVYINCSCIPTSSVEVGHCSGGNCRMYWWIFEVLILVVTAFLGSGILGNLLICFRSVLPGDKSITIGVLFAVPSFIARVPLKYLYDFIANLSCLYYYDGQCRIYSSDKLASYINLFHIFILLAAVGMLCIVCFLVRDLPLYVNQSPPKNHSLSEPMTEMSDFRSQLNQALKVRRESVAEEQKLLSESTKTSLQRGHENGNRRASFIEDDDKNIPSMNVQNNQMLQKPLIPIKTSSVIENNGNANHLSNSISSSIQPNSVKISSLLKPLVPIKPPSVVKDVKENISISSNNSTPPPSSPTRSTGATIRDQGYLTTLL